MNQNNFLKVLQVAAMLLIVAAIYLLFKFEYSPVKAELIKILAGGCVVISILATLIRKKTT